MLRKIVCLKKKVSIFFFLVLWYLQKRFRKHSKAIILVNYRPNRQLITRKFDLSNSFSHFSETRRGSARPCLYTRSNYFSNWCVIKSLPPSNIKVLMDLLQNRLLNLLFCLMFLGKPGIRFLKSTLRHHIFTSRLTFCDAESTCLSRFCFLPTPGENASLKSQQRSRPYFAKFI